MINVCIIQVSKNRQQMPEDFNPKRQICEETGSLFVYSSSEAPTSNARNR